MTLPRYPEYQVWELARSPLPSHWDTIPLMRVASMNDDVLPESTDPTFEIEYVDIGSVTLDRGIEQTQQFNFAAAPSRARRLVRDGDILVSTVRTYLKAIAPIRLPASNLVVSTGFAVVRPGPRLHSGFAKYSLQSSEFVDEVISRSTGVSYPAINASDLARIRLPLPPNDEQSAIAAFLERETAKIDALIAEQEKLIALLAEKRQATISHAVTKGLNPDAPMKDSGVPWLGEVPGHWEINRLKSISPQITVGIVVEPSKYYVDSGVPALRSLNVAPGRVVEDNFVFISVESNELLSKSRLRAGDLVSVRSGQTGTTAVVPESLDGCNCIDLIIIRKPRDDSEQFLCWFLGSDAAIQQFSSGSGGAIQQHFNIGTAMNLQIPLPPREEQDAIVKFLEAESAKIESLHRASEQSIDLLQERRSALIAAAVTGQIDVRGLY